MVAAFFAAGEVEVFAQEVEERGAGVDGEGPLLLVDGKGDRDGLDARGGGVLSSGGGAHAGGDPGGNQAGGGEELAAGELEIGVLFGSTLVHLDINHFRTGTQAGPLRVR